jgi:hypothetical protein
MTSAVVLIVDSEARGETDDVCPPHFTWEL